MRIAGYKYNSNIRAICYFPQRLKQLPPLRSQMNQSPRAQKSIFLNKYNNPVFHLTAQFRALLQHVFNYPQHLPNHLIQFISASTLLYGLTLTHIYFYK